jgi:hypothetical protein
MFRSRTVLRASNMPNCTPGRAVAMDASSGRGGHAAPARTEREGRAHAGRQCYLRGDAGRCAAAAGTTEHSRNPRMSAHRHHLLSCYSCQRICEHFIDIHECWTSSRMPWGSSSRPGESVLRCSVHILIVAHLFQRETFDYDLQIEMALSSTSTVLQFGVSAVHITEKGNAPNLVPTLRISMTCGSCLVNSQQVAIGSLKSIRGSATNAVPISPWREIWPQVVFYQRAYAGGSLSNSWSQPFSRVIRCDHWYPTNWTSPGCVFPAYVPSVDMSSLSAIAKNIRLVQGRGIHIGQPGSGNPLHRNTGPQESKNNRSISCPESVPRPAGYQCDEYPFASSFEGGAAMSPPNRISAWVPAVENSLQGQKLQDFYRTNRLIQGSPGDAYYVYAG